jgi:hypothetical protein
MADKQTAAGRRNGKRQSPVRELVTLVEANAGGRSRSSWRVLNEALRSAVSLAVVGGFAFELDDVAWIAALPGAEHWFDGEDFYRLACTAPHGANLSAARSFEHWKKRAPFIVRRATWFTHRRPERNSDRITVGTRFGWRGEIAHCTSFAADGKSLVACAYKGDPYGDKEYSRDSRKVLRRIRITHADIRTYHGDLERVADLGHGADGLPEAVAKKLHEAVKAQIAEWLPDEVPLSQTAPYRLNSEQLTVLEQMVAAAREDESSVPSGVEFSAGVDDEAR